jgi:hypothetical protein
MTPDNDAHISGSRTQIGVLDIAEAAAEYQQASILPRVEGVRNAGAWSASESVRLVVVTRARSIERTKCLASVFLL